MKRPFAPTENYLAKFNDVKADFSTEQLAGVGAVAMNYNELEAELFALFMFASGLDPKLQLDVFTRINGIDGVIEIIKKGVAILGISPADQTELNDALGKGLFGLLKAYRDAIVHARMYNAPLGIGIRAGRQAALFEVLLTKDALDILYEHISALTLQLRDAVHVLVAAREIKRLDSADPKREPHEALAAHLSAQFLEHRMKRQSLRPLPEFPSESELKQARDNWWQKRTAEQLAWYQQLPQPQQRKGLPEAVKSTTGAQAPPHPLRDQD